MGRIFTWLAGKIQKKHSLVVVKKFAKFNAKHRNKVSSEKLKACVDSLDAKYLYTRPGRFELYDNVKIIFINVPFREIYCECNVEEYKELSNYIYVKYEQSVSLSTK